MSESGSQFVYGGGPGANLSYQCVQLSLVRA
jgi:hypothetical protein